MTRKELEESICWGVTALWANFGREKNIYGYIDKSTLSKVNELLCEINKIRNYALDKG